MARISWGGRQKDRQCIWFTEIETEYAEFVGVKAEISALITKLQSHKLMYGNISVFLWVFISLLVSVELLWRTVSNIGIRFVHQVY